MARMGSVMKGWSLVSESTSTVGWMPRRGGGTAVSAVVSSKYSCQQRRSRSHSLLLPVLPSPPLAELMARRGCPKTS